MTAQRVTRLNLVGILALVVVLLLAILPPHRGGILNRFLPGLRLGLDLQGGTQLTYEADMKDVLVSDRATALDGVRDVIERRVNAFGVAEPLIQIIRGGTPRVIVELAGVHDVEAAIRQIGETPQLDFREEGETTKLTGPDGKEIELPGWKRTELTGRHLKRADVAFQPQSGAPQIALVFDGDGRNLFAELTKRTVGKRIAIFLDGIPITAPVVQETITAGEAVITGSFTIAEAKQLAARLNAGALPVPISLVTRTTVGPTLGKDSLAQSILAGGIGFFLLATIMVLLYRLSGLVALLVLLLYGLLLIVILQTLGATLTLAGIAGIILSLGMAVDANVLIFERLKEEIRKGRTLQAAAAEGFQEAWPSIRDSNIASLITAALLYGFGSSVVRGFATTLAIGILASMFTGVAVTRVLLRALSFVPALTLPRWYCTVAHPLAAPAHTVRILAFTPLWLGFSALLMIASVIGISIFGIRPGIDFTGGSLLELRGNEVTVSAVRDVLNTAGETAVTVQDTGNRTLLARLRALSTEEHASLLAQLTTRFPQLEELRFETIGPTIGRELLRKAIIAVLLAILLILVYLSIVFRRATSTVSPWAFGTIAVLALVHDLVIMTGAFVLLSRYHGATADSLFLTAALTLLGFSVHDTIVVFNRVKTNLQRIRASFRDLVYRSVAETITRSVNTSATTLFVLLALFFFGSSATQSFVATLSVGIVVGTYSSIFVAAPLLIAWQARRGRSWT